MKVKVKSAWLDAQGIHKKGDVLDVDVKDFDPLRMIALEDETPKAEEKPKTTKKSKK